MCRWRMKEVEEGERRESAKTSKPLIKRQIWEHFLSRNSRLLLSHAWRSYFSYQQLQCTYASAVWESW